MAVALIRSRGRRKSYVVEMRAPTYARIFKIWEHIDTPYDIARVRQVSLVWTQCWAA